MVYVFYKKELIIFSVSLSNCTLLAHISGIRARMPGQSRLDATFGRNFYPSSLQPTFRSRVLVLTWANWLNCPYINNPNTLAGSRPLPTTPVTLPHSSCLPYLTKTKSQIQRQRRRQTRWQGQDLSSTHLSPSLPGSQLLSALSNFSICRYLKYL